MKAKALMHGDIFVDMMLIEKGIYESKRPVLFFSTETIEKLIKDYKELEKSTSMSPEISFYENLSKCKLVEVNILTNEELGLNGLVDLLEKSATSLEAQAGEGYQNLLVPKLKWYAKKLDNLIKQ